MDNLSLSQGILKAIGLGANTMKAIVAKVATMPVSATHSSPFIASRLAQLAKSGAVSRTGEPFIYAIGVKGPVPAAKKAPVEAKKLVKVEGMPAGAVDAIMAVLAKQVDYVWAEFIAKEAGVNKHIVNKVLYKNYKTLGVSILKETDKPSMYRIVK